MALGPSTALLPSLPKTHEVHCYCLEQKETDRTGSHMPALTHVVHLIPKAVFFFFESYLFMFFCFELYVWASAGHMGCTVECAWIYILWPYWVSSIFDNLHQEGNCWETCLCVCESYFLSLASSLCIFLQTCKASLWHGNIFWWSLFHPYPTAHRQKWNHPSLSLFWQSSSRPWLRCTFPNISSAVQLCVSHYTHFVLFVLKV